MGIDERIVLFVLGCVLGFILGYIVRMLRDIKEELDEIDECVHDYQQKKRDERGVMKLPTVRGVALFLVVALTFYAAVMSQNASNRSNDTSDRVIAAQNAIVSLQSEQKQNLDCTTQVLFDAIRALNERTTYSGAQADANIALVQGQLDLLLRVQDPSLTDEEGQILFQAYVTKVQEFIDLANKTKSQQLEFPYPTVSDLTKCLSGVPNDTDPNPSEGSTPTPSADATSPSDVPETNSPSLEPSPTG